MRNLPVDSVLKLAPFISYLLSEPVSVEHVALDDYRVTYRGVSFILDIPAAYSLEQFEPFYKGEGHVVFKGEVPRFVRHYLGHVHIARIYPHPKSLKLNLSDAPKPEYVSRTLDLYYKGTWWVDLGEMIAYSLKTSSTIDTFNKLVSRYLMSKELVSTQCGPLVMSQEMEIEIPSKTTSIRHWEVATSQFIGVSRKIREAMALYALGQGYRLSTTSKSDPGSIVTKASMDTPDKRCILSYQLLPISIERKCRAGREQRGIRGAIPFNAPSTPRLSTENYPLSSTIKPYITMVNSVVADFPHTVPSYTPEWSPKKGMNKDRIVLTPSGVQALESPTVTEELVPYTIFHQNRERFESLPDYEYVGEEVVPLENYIVKKVRIRFSNSKPVSLKLVTPSGLKGMSESIRTQFYASVKSDIENDLIYSPEDIQSLVDKGDLIPIDTIISASAIYSKKSHVLLIQGAMELALHLKDDSMVIPPMDPKEVCSPKRTEDVLSKSIVSEYDDYIDTTVKPLLESAGLPKDGKLYIYGIYPQGYLYLAKDIDGTPLRAPVIRHCIWRTRHSDAYGEEVKVYKDEQNSGISYDIHTSSLAGLKYKVPAHIEQVLNKCYETVKNLPQY